MARKRVCTRACTHTQTCTPKRNEKIERILRAYFTGSKTQIWEYSKPVTKQNAKIERILKAYITGTENFNLEI